MRILERIEQVYAIGAGPGANRVGGSQGEQERTTSSPAGSREAGLAVEVDPDGNLFGRLPGDDPDAGEVWVGSHLDSVPNGGRFDGVLGVLAGLEAVERIGRRAAHARGRRVPRRGARVRRQPRARRARGLSRALRRGAHRAGPRARARAARRSASSPASSASRAARSSSKARPATPARRRWTAGTTRSCTAAELVLRVRDAAVAIPQAVATVGRLEVEPGAANVIPERAIVSVDARAPDRERLDALVAAIGFEPSLLAEPARDGRPRAGGAARGARARAACPPPSSSPGAGHDAGVLAAAGVRCGMLFVRSGAGGISHSPDEWSDPEDVALCVDVLAAALGRLASAP